jgi:hypothetical protein
VSTRLSALRQLLAQQFPDAAPLTSATPRSTRAITTGLAPIDGILPGQGLPRAKLTVWAPDGGATAVLRSACQAVISLGERAAWVDAASTWGPDWQDGPLLIRPTDPMRRMNALRSAEILLRSGGFALVVLSGVESEGTETVRLTRAAREGGSAFVTLTRGASMASLRIASRILPHSYRWRPGPFQDPAIPIEATVEVRARALGWNARARVTLPVTPYELRLSLDPGLPDRRGVERSKRRGSDATTR